MSRISFQISPLYIWRATREMEVKRMTTFLALYRGHTIMSAELVAVSADQALVKDFGRRLVTDEPGVGSDALMDEHVHRPRGSAAGNGSYNNRRPHTKSS
jgi:hypothetical protein